MGVAVETAFGAPEDVIQIADQPPLSAGPGQVVIDLEIANINPSDCLTVRGLYGILPQSFPATLGNEGIGRVSAVGRVCQILSWASGWPCPSAAVFGPVRFWAARIS